MGTLIPQLWFVSECGSLHVSAFWDSEFPKSIYQLLRGFLKNRRNSLEHAGSSKPCTGRLGVLTDSMFFLIVKQFGRPVQQVSTSITRKCARLMRLSPQSIGILKERPESA